MSYVVRQMAGEVGLAGGRVARLSVTLLSADTVRLELTVDDECVQVLITDVLSTLRSRRSFKALLCKAGQAEVNNLLLRSERALREIRDAVAEAYVNTFGP